MNLRELENLKTAESGYRSPSFIVLPQKAATPPSALMLAVRRLIELLSRGNGHSQPILFRRQRASRIRSYRTRRVISSVEVKHNGSIHHGAGFKKASAWISVALRRQVIENEKQPLGRVAAQIRKLYFLALDLEYSLTRYCRG